MMKSRPLAPWLVLAAAVIALVLPACSTVPPDSDDPWTNDRLLDEIPSGRFDAIFRRD